ncbi:unnamed protein product [Adineta ricciae]|uniref:Uncharacterized protein n=1 Tax=Adineta ricciae TaxID=249248 RepID=A0A815WKH9_ADIRI|nr:unnamed protein product [Adineta ricciae]
MAHNSFSCLVHNNLFITKNFATFGHFSKNISYLDTNPTSKLSLKLFDNIAKIEQGIGFEFLLLLDMLVRIIGSMVICFVINWKLTLIMLSVLPLVIGASVIFSKIIANETMNELNTYSKAGHIVQEVFSSLRTVLSLNGTKFEQRRYERELDPTRWSSVRKGAIFGVFMGWISVISYIIYSVGFIFGSILMSYESNNTLNISDILVVVTIFVQNMQFFSSVGPFFQSFSEARSAATQVFQLIDEAQETSINEAEICEDSKSDEQSININDVPVLRNLNFIARAGQTTALVGSSGCGKSTCISLLLCYYETTLGQIMINGRSITDYKLKQFRQNIGVVSQEPILFGISIYENIRFGKINATRAEIEEAAQQANAHNFIMQLPNKYETLVGERGIQLSGGEKQRIALARALVKQPTLLLLDEATSALDNVNEKIVQEALDRACQSRTTIIIAHRLSTIQNAHYIYVLDSGSVIEQGTHETLMAKEGGKYQKMVKSQQIERTNDDYDHIISMTKKDDEDEKQTLAERSRLLSDIQAVGVDKESSVSSSHQFIFLRLLSMNSPEWSTILFGCVTSLMNGAAQPIFAILLAKIVNAFKDCMNFERHHQVLISCFILLLMGVISFILRFFQYTAFAISGSKLTQRIRSKAFACLLRQEVAYFDQTENSSGAISTRLSTDASAIQELTGSRLGVICQSFAMSCIGLLFGIFFNWQLTMIIFFSSFTIAILGYLYIRFNMWLNQQSGLIIERASSLAIEVIHNMRTIKQLSVEKEVLQQYSKLLHQNVITFQKYSLLTTLPYGIYWAIDAYTLALLFWRALVLVEQHKINVNNIVMIAAFAIFATQAFKFVINMGQQIGRSLSAAKNFFDLFDRIPTIDNTSTEGQELVDFHGEIKFDQVNFAYPTRPSTVVLNKFQLNIKPGQRVALVGASGCGKSTVIQLLERFYDVGQGQLLLDGINTRQLNLHWIRSRFGLVSQEPILFDLTIAENITYGLENIPMEDIMNAATKANIHPFIQQLPQGYETKVGMKGSFLSGGEKQRIAIARVLLRRPKVLLLDEATSAMDSHNEQMVQQALEQAQTEDPSRTSLIIAHRLSTIQSCDLICVIDKGHIIESGTHTELLQRHGTYYMMLTQNNP